MSVFAFSVLSEELSDCDKVHLLSGFVDTAIDAVIALDQTGAVFGWAEGAERTFGFTADQAFGKRLEELIIPPESAAMHVENIRYYMETRQSHLIGKRVEMDMLDSKRHRFPVELAVAPITFKDHVYFIVRIRDIAERRKSETQLLALVGQRRIEVVGPKHLETILTAEAKEEAIKVIVETIAKAQDVLNAYIKPGRVPLTAVEAGEKVHKLLGVLDNMPLRLAQSVVTAPKKS